MTDKEILIRAVKKAVAGGFNWNDDTQWEYPVYQDGLLDLFYVRNCRQLLFSHDFAKAFWGEDFVCGDCGEKDCIRYCGGSQAPEIRLWFYHLQRMVGREKPIQYLKEFIS